MLRAFLRSFNNLHKDKDWVEWEDFERKRQCKICHSGAEHKMVQYLEPLQLFRESMKRTYYMPPAVFLGLSISDKNNYHMDRLCKKGRFKSLKYTCWEDDIASRSALFECYGSGWKTFPVDCSRECSEIQEDFERTSAEYMLGASLLIPVEWNRVVDDQEHEANEEMEDSEEEMEDIDKGKPTRRWRIQRRRRRRWRIQTRRWHSLKAVQDNPVKVF